MAFLLGMNLVRLLFVGGGCSGVEATKKRGLHFPEYPPLCIGQRRNNQDHEDDEAANGDLLYGIVGTSLAVLTILGACLSRDSIRISFPYLEAAGECLADMPPLMIQPVVETLKKMLLLSLFLYSASRLLSLRLALDNVVFALVALFFVVVFFWLVEVMGSLSRYVLGFLTEEFVFSPYDARNDSKQVPPYVTSEAYKSALVYHFGSLCLGSIANVALKPLRTILRIVTAPTRFGCCLIAFQGMTDFQGRLAAYSDAAYLAMALDGHSYFEATQDSLQMLGAEGQLEAAWLDSTLLEVQLLGTVASASLVAVIVRIMARSMWTFSNVGSELYVEDDGAVAFAAFIVALLCSWCFMESVGFVADALIFSFRAQSKGYLGLTAMVSERAALCEVPDCISVDRRGQPAALNPFTSYPPKLTQLLTFVNNRRGGYGFGLTDSSTSRGYGGYGGYSQASSGWSTPR
ncbi:Slc44a5 [Symbiodinium sp. KB8]|nr:Slc44a5 [Symbiodinium sp. KB8]